MTILGWRIIVLVDTPKDPPLNVAIEASVFLLLLSPSSADWKKHSNSPRPLMWRFPSPAPLQQTACRVLCLWISMLATNTLAPSDLLLLDTQQWPFMLATTTPWFMMLI